MKKKCEICGKDFEAGHVRAKYCSDECKRIQRRKWSRKWYYSHLEKARADGRRTYRRRKKKHPSPVYERNCLMCGEPFSTTRSTQKYCCSKCGKRYRNLKQGGKEPEAFQSLSYNKCRRLHDDCNTCEHPDCIF